MMRLTVTNERQRIFLRGKEWVKHCFSWVGRSNRPRMRDRLQLCGRVLAGSGRNLESDTKFGTFEHHQKISGSKEIITQFYFLIPISTNEQGKFKVQLGGGTETDAKCRGPAKPLTLSTAGRQVGLLLLLLLLSHFSDVQKRCRKSISEANSRNSRR